VCVSLLEVSSCVCVTFLILAESFFTRRGDDDVAFVCVGVEVRGDVGVVGADGVDVVDVVVVVVAGVVVAVVGGKLI
jgi:hypothetical protein